MASEVYLPHRIIIEDLRLVGDCGVPDDPADVVEGQRREQVLVHLRPPAVQRPERRTKNDGDRCLVVGALKDSRVYEGFLY